MSMHDSQPDSHGVRPQPAAGAGATPVNMLLTPNDPPIAPTESAHTLSDRRQEMDRMDYERWDGMS